MTIIAPDDTGPRESASTAGTEIKREIVRRYIMVTSYKRTHLARGCTVGTAVV
ncbi:MAG: hypothetical protein AB1553_11485 [Nitrospirota bacterium]